VYDGLGQALLISLDDVHVPPEPGAGTSNAVAVASFERRAMGSPLRLTIVGLPEARAAMGWEAVSTAIEEIEQALSRFRPTSDLSALNAHAGDPACVPVGRWLCAALAAADRAHRVTGGAFEPRVLRDLERLGYAGAPIRASAPLGSPAEASSTLPAPGNGTVDGLRWAFADRRWLHLDPRGRRAAVAAPVDLGGIGKGLAIRWAMAILERTLPDLAARGAGALLEAGGDIVARGAAPQDGPWMIGIEDPRGGEELAVIAVEDGAACTSSIGVHAWTAPDGRAVHHLVDPRTGEPGGAGLLAVTVAGPDPAWAEVWSKTLFLEGAAGIAARARGLGLAAWWVYDDDALEMTPAARARTAWLASEA
jgi:thiamine biosynthesis lipoprotein